MILINNKVFKNKQGYIEYILDILTLFQLNLIFLFYIILRFLTINA